MPQMMKTITKKVKETKQKIKRDIRGSCSKSSTMKVNDYNE
jgi:hypothetical protein